MTSVGYGDVLPVNYIECIFTSFMLFTSSIIFVYSINAIGSILNNIS